MNELPHIPVLRLGKPYRSMDLLEVKNHKNQQPLATIGVANNGLIRRDLMRVQDSFDALQELSSERLIEICREAGRYFMNEALPLGDGGSTQSPQEYIETLSSTSGLPHTLCRKNMAKINEVFTEMDTILSGLTRGLDLKILDNGIGTHAGSPVSFFPQTNALGAVLPSNSPGVNSIWMPSIALKVPVILKPGREEPWTPFRIIQAFIAAGCPREAFGFYPTTHEGSNTIMTMCKRSIIFGDEKTIARYANDPAVQVHGPGWSKVFIGEDRIEHWRDYLDVIADSVVLNGGRSCINASAVIVPKYGRKIAEALAERLVQIQPKAADDDAAQLSAFANTAFADYIDGAIDQGLDEEGAEDVTAKKRNCPRRAEIDGCVFLHPTVVYCESFEHPLADREFLFPYTSVVEMPQDEILDRIGESLVVTAITEDRKWITKLLQSPKIQRLNIGALPTSKVKWDQPHEGNLFEFLYSRRAVQQEKVA